jgi:hypothetical protein
MATIALRNSPSGNCHPRLEPQPKGEKLPQQLGKSHTPRERRQRKPARSRDSVPKHCQNVSGEECAVLTSFLDALRSMIEISPGFRNKDLIVH